MQESPVVISYPTLVSSPDNLLPEIGNYSLASFPIVFNSVISEKAFGSDPNSLGIIIVRDLPEEYEEHRDKLLKLAYKFGQLDYNVREGYSDPLSKYRCVHRHSRYPGLYTTLVTALAGPMARHVDLPCQSIIQANYPLGDYEWQTRWVFHHCLWHHYCYPAYQIHSRARFTQTLWSSSLQFRMKTDYNFPNTMAKISASPLQGCIHYR
jgi:hypothetical protein